VRVLVAADIHGVLRVYQWLVGLTDAVDALVLAGDLLDGDEVAGQWAQVLEIAQILRQSKCPVLYIMGNDDNIALGIDDEPIRSIHGRRIEIREYNFVGYAYSPPFVGEMFVKNEEEIGVDLRSLSSLVDRQTVLVTHAPAYGSLDVVFGNNVGSRAIADFLLHNPVLVHVHGHIHACFGRDGNHFNVAAAGTTRAMVIDLPFLRHEVVRQP
jgi:Icc-related predicted phosphoesterase